METVEGSQILSSWDLFVLRHRVPANLVVHFIAWILYFISPVLALIYWDWRWLLGLFLSGMIGALGHYIFHDGTLRVSEATYDPKTPLFVSMMFYKIFTGTYWQEVARVERILDQTSTPKE